MLLKFKITRTGTALVEAQSFISLRQITPRIQWSCYDENVIENICEIHLFLIMDDHVTQGVRESEGIKHTGAIVGEDVNGES